MMVAEETLPSTLQALIDARLDTIDRMLLGRVPRADRTAITREVESQIHDLLAERGGGEVDRDQILSALARLDPPEAYLLDEATGESPVVRRPSPPPPFVRERAPASRAGQISGIVGLLAIGIELIAVIALAIAFMESSNEAAILSLVVASMALIVGIVGLGLSAYARLADNWAVIGLATGLITVLSGLATILFVILG